MKKLLALGFSLCLLTSSFAKSNVETLDADAKCTWTTTWNGNTISVTAEDCMTARKEGIDILVELGWG